MWGKSKKDRQTDHSDAARPIEAASATADQPSLSADAPSQSGAGESGPSFGPLSNPSNPPGLKTKRFRGWRGWLLRLSLCVISPLLFFGLLEAGLRVGGYGYPTGFFLGPDAKGVCTTNYKFGWRFFPRALARDPHPSFLAPKPAGKIRIVVLGESAAMGTPDPAFGFGPILGVMLREQYPGLEFEIVNGAMTAINSYASLEIARDCAAHQPDLYVLYMGNNEVIGPYGPGTVFEHWSPSLSLIRASLWVKSTRVGELLGDVVSCFRGEQVVAGHWRGLAMFMKNPVPADDPRLTVAYDNYRRNLTDICRTAHRAGAAVVLSTVAVNLKDFPPLASLHRGDLTAEDLAKWEAIYKAAGELQAGDRWPEALVQYEAAAAIDDRYAELQFHIGECLIRAGRAAEAEERFELARDLDVMRFRADSRINTIIRDVAGEQAAAGVRLVEAQRALESGDQSTGARPPHSNESLFYEHVHLTFDGNYLLARAIFDQVCQALPQLADSNKHGTIPSRQRCADLLAFTPWNEYQSAADMVEITESKPFADQFDHDRRQAAALQHCDDLHSLATTPQAKAAAWKTYEEAIAKAPDDWNLHHHFGKLAMQFGQTDVAIEHFRVALARVPWNTTIRNDLGVALASQGQIDEAIAHYQAVLDINPNDLSGHFNLGVVLAARGKADEAIAHFRRALEIAPDFAATHFKLATVLVSKGEIDEAITQFQSALKIKPDMANAHNNLASILVRRGQIDEAVEHYRKAVEIKPDYEEACNNLGYLLFRKGDLAGAAEAFQRAVDINPGFAEAHFNLGLALEARGQFDEAAVHFQKALEIKPDWAAAFNKMAAFRTAHPELKTFHAASDGSAATGGTASAGTVPDSRAKPHEPTKAGEESRIKP